jgi:uncharacterized protein YutE (UPF0331/DUF86 family)
MCNSLHIYKSLVNIGERASIQELYRLTSKRYNELSTDEKYSIRYNIIVLVEALVALCSHIAVEELGKIPRSYRESVRIVAEYLNIPCIDDLETLVGLRNLLIHRYQIILDDKVYSFIKRVYLNMCYFAEIKLVIARALTYNTIELYARAFLQSRVGALLRLSTLLKTLCVSFLHHLN